MLLCLLLGGCAGAAVSGSSDGQASQTQQADAAIGNGNASVVVENETGSTITGLSIKVAGASDYPSEGMSSNLVFGNGTKTSISFVAVSACSLVFRVKL